MNDDELEMISEELRAYAEVVAFETEIWGCKVTIFAEDDGEVEIVAKKEGKEAFFTVTASGIDVELVSSSGREKFEKVTDMNELHKAFILL